MMDGMDDLVQFLRDRLDETAARASAATPGPWSVNDKSYAESIDGPDGVTVVGGSRWGGEASVFESTADALHIAEHDPARVLAEVDAKREILRWHSSPHTVVDGFCADEGGPCKHRGEAFCTLCGETACTTLRLLALPHADHPDYREQWRPGAPGEPDAQDGEHEFHYDENGAQRCARCRLPHAHWSGGPCPGSPQDWEPGKYV